MNNDTNRFQPNNTPIQYIGKCFTLLNPVGTIHHSIAYNHTTTQYYVCE